LSSRGHAVAQEKLKIGVIVTCRSARARPTSCTASRSVKDLGGKMAARCRVVVVDDELNQTG